MVGLQSPKLRIEVRVLAPLPVKKFLVDFLKKI